jgi:exopolysaccharide production protein ExoZ
MTAVSPLKGRVPAYRGIQALRAIAALLVVANHATLVWHEYSLAPMWPAGAVGVDIFFIISGFVMAVSSVGLVREGHPARRFLERRIIRIVPMYWLLTFVVILKIYMLQRLPQFANSSDQAQLSLPFIVKSLLFIPMSDPHGAMILPLLYPGWTLSYEMLFYFLFAAALALRVNAAKLLAPIMIGLAVVSLFHRASWPGITLLFSPLMLEFLAGVILGQAVNRGIRWNVPLWVTLGLIGFVLMMTVPLVSATLRVVIWGIPALLVVIAVVAIEEQYGRRWPKWTLLLGDASYSLYLVHPLVLTVLTKFLVKAHVLQTGVARTQDECITIVASVLTVCVVALLIYPLVEKPMTNALRRKLLGEGKPKSQVV